MSTPRMESKIRSICKTIEVAKEVSARCEVSVENALLAMQIERGSDDVTYLGEVIETVFITTQKEKK